MSAPLLSRFRGSLVGAVLGDCIGAVFEGVWLPGIKIEKVLKLINRIETEGKKCVQAENNDDQDEGKQKEPRQWCFTDDTAMARSVAASLIENKGLDVRHMARRFTSEYFKEPGRGYGASVGIVFNLLQESDCLDTYGPARKQFDGQGSYGNGGAMRIAPAGLFANRMLYDSKQLKDLVEQITRITHSNDGAIQGAILECAAVDLALKTSSLDVDKFLDELVSIMRPLEEESLERAKELAGSDSPPAKRPAKRKSEEEDLPYCFKLEKIREYVKQEEQPDTSEINDVLGTDISAVGSVPAAVYSFLRATKDIDNVQDRNSFERTIIYAISLGGDTDTIATMAGAIAGAYYGIELIPQSWQTCCEGVEDALRFSEDLHNLSVV